MAAPRTKPTTAAPVVEEKRFEVTEAQLAGIVDGAVAKALGARPALAAAVPEAPKKITNADFLHMSSNPLMQTQEDATIVALTVGPSSHSKQFLPAVPEFVATRDREDNRTLIDRIEAMGYVVELRGVEFSARFEPLDKDGVKLYDQTEPEASKPFLEKLGDADAVHSTVWLRRWFEGRPVGGERAVDEMAAEVKHGAQKGIPTQAEVISGISQGVAQGMDAIPGLDNMGDDVHNDVLGGGDLNKIDSVSI